MRITHDLISQCNFYVTPLYHRTLDMRGYQIIEIDNLSATLDYYDGIDLSNNIIEILDSYATLKNLRSLICNFNKINSIKNISDAFPNLENLVLMNNSIRSFNNIQELKKFKNLKRLYLNNNPITLQDDYRLKIIAMIPSLKVLDFQNISNKIRTISKQKYQDQFNDHVDFNSMSKKQKLKLVIEKTQNIDEIMQLESLMNEGEISEYFLNQKLKQVNNNQLMLNFRIKELQKEQLSEAQLKLNNRVSTTLYTMFNFLPLGLYYQFKQITNCYFLGIAILNVIPFVAAVDPYSAFVPVAFVILFSLLFDWFDDFKRYLSDRRTNNSPVTIIRDGEVIQTMAKKIQIGDYLIVKENERFEADIILMTFRSPNDQCYIDTCSLDGEKALKNKLSILDISIKKNYFEKQNQNQIISDLEINYEQNTADLNHFQGNLKIQIQDGEQSKEIFERLNKQNFIPRSSYLRSTLEVVGLVVYIGKDTKVVKNTQQRIFKNSSLFRQMQKYIIFILIALVLLCIILTLIASIKRSEFNYMHTVLKHKDNLISYIAKTFLTYILLMNTLLPISLIITLQLLNLIQNLTFLSEKKFDEIGSNKTLGINTININEELGQIEYILSDKTGTLTQNLMIARYFLIGEFQLTLRKHEKVLSCFQDSKKSSDLNIKSQQYLVTDKQLEKDPKKYFETNEQDRLDTTNKLQSNNSWKTNYSSQQSFKFKELILSSQDGQKEIQFEDQKEVNELFFCILNSCHECFSTNQEGEKSNNKFDNLRNHIQYQGQSPDEIALLTGCKNNSNILMKGADNKKILLYSKEKQDFEIEKIFNFPFDNFRKRMSNLVKIDGNYYLVMKGADHSVSSVCDNKLKESQLELFDYYLQEGLRVMLVAIKLLSEDEVKQFLDKLNQLEKEQHEDDAIYQHQLKLEQNMYLLGVTAVEDKLQENLKETVDLMKLAQMKVWVITGDKTETAVNIAYSSGLFDKEHYPPVFFNKEILENQIQSQPTCRKSWRQPTRNDRRRRSKTLKKMESRDRRHDGELLSSYLKEQSLTNKNLVVENDVLKLALENKKYRQAFTRYIKKYECVVFAKTNPNEKVEIVRLLKESGKKVLAIGDGANDVNMIQEANVGVGIIGEEGQQAQNASDYAVPKFKNLQGLLFSFGRISYYRNAQFILLFFYKNILFTIPQFYYAYFSNFSRINIWNDWYMSFFNLIFTSTNVASLALSNHDMPNDIQDYKNKMTIQSMIYFQGQNNLLFTKKKFFGWILIACLESLLVIVLFKVLIDDNIIPKYSEGDFNFFSYTMYTIIIYYLNLKLFLINFNYSPIFILGLLISLISLIIYTYLTNNSRIFGYYKTANRTIESQLYWHYIVFLVGILLLFNLCFYTLKRYIFPNTKSYVRGLKKDYESEKVILQLNEKRKQALKKNRINQIFH